MKSRPTLHFLFNHPVIFCGNTLFWWSKVEIKLYILFNSKIHHILDIKFVAIPFYIVCRLLKPSGPTFFLLKYQNQQPPSHFYAFCGKCLNKVIGLRLYYYYFIMRSIYLFKKYIFANLFATFEL